MVFEREDGNAVDVRRGVGLLMYRLIEAYANRNELNLKNEIQEVEIIIRRGLEDPDVIVSGHFRMCFTIYKEYTKLSKPLIEELLSVCFSI